MARCIEGKPNRFITFTCRAGQFANEAETAKAMVAAWRTIVLRWRRLKKWHRCEYIAVFEPHISGWPHMHILWKGHWIDQKFLSEQGKLLLNSPVQHVSLIRDEKSAAFYVAKYFSKAPVKFGKSKRYWTSKNWPKLKLIAAEKAFHKGFPMELVNKKISLIIETWKRYGKTVWGKPPDVWGWGILWEPQVQPRLKKRPEYSHTFGFQVSTVRRKSGREVLGRAEDG